MQGRQRLLVARVGLQPHGRAHGIHVVVDGREGGRLVAVEIVEVEGLFGRIVGGVVELVAAHAHLDRGLAHVLVAVLEDGAEARAQIVVVVLAHEVADEVGAVLAGHFQLLLGAAELVLEGVQDDQTMVLG